MKVIKPDHSKKIKFTSEEISVFCEQIAMLLNSGIPIHEGVYMLFSEMEDKKTKDVLGRLNEGVKANLPLYQALKETECFPEYMIHMVQVGETTGKLEVEMKSLADYYERESNVKAGIKSAITYPMVLFVMMSVIIFVLVSKILPLFQSMFDELNKDLAQSTQNMMNIGIMLGKILAAITCILFVLIIFEFLWYKTKRGNEQIHYILVNFVLTRRLMEAMATGDFLSSMALMISSGIELQKAMDLSYAANTHGKVKDKIKQCKEMMERGYSLEETISETKLLVGMESRLVSVAAKTGAQDTVFAKLSEQYNQKITSMLNKLSTTIETILVVSLAILVGAVLISVMLPLVSMISSIG